ncbi:uncharacterized protein K452DRAFT_301587 [Aplosporella prunicola CBS 121167]|uniref:Uncharacterized protein n=1 Tax=Aplosporella prunicola CBS 121167 TaxID=1176127 RepID=A0A6A6B2P0_9PEZI|nr:uncharacterized protein K452DRAFT_301587 [Aplosporella prunicola CBS 121167]KAF2137858.1 hypothetical protein K452DRAFT_301587 [Aplosporella prunicola CBS 121167]
MIAPPELGRQVALALKHSKMAFPELGSVKSSSSCHSGLVEHPSIREGDIPGLEWLTGYLQLLQYTSLFSTTFCLLEGINDKDLWTKTTSDRDPVSTCSRLEVGEEKVWSILSNTASDLDVGSKDQFPWCASSKAAVPGCVSARPSSPTASAALSGRHRSGGTHLPRPGSSSSNWYGLQRRYHGWEQPKHK